MTKIKVNQPTAAPNRKIWAVIIAGIVTAAAQAILTEYAPDLPIADMIQQLDVWVQAAIMVIAGYMTREAV